jgi:hypothetical protein
MYLSFRHTALGVAVFGLTSALTFVPAQAATPAWRIVHTNTLKSVGSDTNLLKDIATLSNKDVWSVGFVATGGGKYAHSLAQHWNGSTWTNTTLPTQFRKSNVASKNNSLTVVAASSSKSVWAFGTANGYSTQYALHWNGKSWAVAHSWKNSSPIGHAMALSASDVWAFGGDTGFGTWHFNGKTWSKVTTPFTLVTAKARSAKDIWAVGYGPQKVPYPPLPLVAHWNGQKWSVVPTPAIESPFSAAFTDLSVASAGDVWAVGYHYQLTDPQSDPVQQPIALHWNGTTWSRADPPADKHGLYSVTPDHKGGVWAAEGEYFNSGGVLHYTGGKWTRPALPKVKGKKVTVGKVSLVPGTTTIWGVGNQSWGTLPFADGIVLKYS